MVEIVHILHVVQADVHCKYMYVKGVMTPMDVWKNYWCPYSFCVSYGQEGILSILQTNNSL